MLAFLFECVSVSNDMQARRKTVSSSRNGVTKTALSEFGSGCWQHVLRCVHRPHSHQDVAIILLLILYSRVI